jgi:two-component system nitrogen regulation sensor histidine kinase NtrY
MSSDNSIELISEKEKFIINGDEEQLYRVFINLIKNSEESFLEKRQKKHGFKGKIHIEITRNNDYIDIKLTDNGTGILDTKKVMTPYFTTKRKGSGLGLPIVSKIINEHSGELVLSNNKKEGVTILISLPVKS